MKPATTKVDKPVTTEIKPKIDKPTPKAEIPIKPSNSTSVNPAVIDVPASTAPKTSSTPVTPPKDDEPKTDDEPHIDVAQHVYGGIKNAWAFGSSIIIVKPFLALTESVAGTVLGLSTGLKLENLDEGLKPKLAEFDNGLINPAIGKVVSLVMPILATGDSIVKRVATTVLGPLGFGGAPAPTIAVEGAPTETTTTTTKDSEQTKETKDDVSTPEMTPIRVPVQ